MNTLENKTKFFAQYWGQDVFIIKDGIDNPGKDIISNDFVSHLELKPLSSISDEDAIEVARMCENIGAIIRTDYLSFGKNYVKYTNWKKCWSFLADYLRSKGYSLSWNGITVEQQIEWKWIKLKDNE